VLRSLDFSVLAVAILVSASEWAEATAFGLPRSNAGKKEIFSFWLYLKATVVLCRLWKGGGGVLSQSLPSVCMLMMNMLSFTSPYWFQLLHMAPFKEQHNNYATASFEKCFFLLLHQNVNMRDDQLITFAKEEFRSRKSDRAENPKHTEGFASTSLFNVCSLEVVSAVLDVCRSNKAPRLPSLCSALLLLYLTHGPFELFN